MDKYTHGHSDSYARVWYRDTFVVHGNILNRILVSYQDRPLSRGGDLVEPKQNPCTGSCPKFVQHVSAESHTVIPLCYTIKLGFYSPIECV